MFEIDIEGIEARSARYARNLDGTYQSHRHGCDHLVSRKLLFDGVSQNVADRHGGPSLFVPCWPPP